MSFSINELAFAEEPFFAAAKRGTLAASPPEGVLGSLVLRRALPGDVGRPTQRRDDPAA